MVLPFLACLIGFEPTILRVGVACVIQLRYKQILCKLYHFLFILSRVNYSIEKTFTLCYNTFVK